MNKTVLQDIQKALNTIHNKINAVDVETKWASLELMLASSASAVALAKKMTKPDTKTATPKISSPKTKISNSLLSKQSNPRRATQFELLSNPSLIKSRYPINKAVNQRLENTH
jgi:hypothetical protein